MQINEKLKETRIRRGWTQEKLAEKIDTNQAMIWRYESGKVQMTLPVFKKWCEALNVSSDEILELPAQVDKKAYSGNR